MNINRIITHLSCFLILVTASCKKDKPVKYEVHPDFNTYINDFIAEGSTRNRYYDFTKLGLVMVYGDLTSKGDAGLCHYETPIRIEIDHKYWNDIAPYNNKEDLRHDVVFHELCHGFIDKRDHKNDTFPNGEWSSMMCGGDKIYKSNNLDFRGFKKQYYLDELFNIKAPAPSWVKNTPTFPETPYSVIFDEEFTSNVNNWPVFINSSTSSRIVSGTYQITNVTDTGYFYAIDKSFIATSDYYLEVNIRLTSSTSKYAGIVWGGPDGGSLSYFAFNSDRHIVVGNYLDYGWYAELYSNAIYKTNLNQLVVHYLNGRLYLYINKRYVFQTEPENIEGTMIGFLSPPHSSIEIDNIILSQSATSTKSGVEQPTVGKFGKMDIDRFNNQSSR